MRVDHLRHLHQVQDQFADTIGRVDPATPVPWCGSWTVHDVVLHLAGVHHWAAAQARRATVTELAAPTDPERHYRECAQELRDTLAEVPPDAVASTLLGEGPAAFWHRRQLHETLVHLWDIRAAGSEPPPEVGPEVWADTVDEVVTVMQPRQVDRGRMPRLGSAIELVATDTPRHWRLDSDDDGPAVATVTGPAASLGLLLWGRLDVTHPSLSTAGDAEVLAAALAQPLTP